MTKFKMTLTGVAVPALLLFASLTLESANSAINRPQNGHDQTGTLQKMIVENGSVTMQLDLNGLNGSGSLVARPVMFLFAAAPNSFFPILIFNDQVRGLEPGSSALTWQGAYSGGVNAPGNLPISLRASLKLLTLK